jgi:hypothetical protein
MSGSVEILPWPKMTLLAIPLYTKESMVYADEPLCPETSTDDGVWY